MTNIPRRQIYETMLIFEDGIMKLNTLIQYHKNFDVEINQFIEENYETMKKSYYEIKALFIMFLENRKYPKGEDFTIDLNKILENKKEINSILFKNKNIPDKFKEIIEKLDNIFTNNNSLNTLIKTKEIYAVFDSFNQQIPEILTLRRDFMK